MLIHRLLNRRLLEQAGQEGGQEGGGLPPSGDGGQDGGQQSTDFFASLDEDLRGALEKNGVQDVSGLAKQFVDLQSHLGNSIRVPSEEAGEEDRKAFYEKLQKHVPDLIPRPDSSNPEAMDALWAQLGKPEEISQYELPEGIEASEVEDLMKYAHEANLTKSQFSSLLSKMAEQSANERAEAQQQFEQAQQTLKQEWGVAFDQNYKAAANLLKQTGAPEAIVQAAEQGKLDPDVAKWAHSLTQRFSSEGTPLTNDSGDSRTMTPMEANAQLDEIYANQNHAFFDPSNPSHERAKQRVVELTAYAIGQKPPK